MLDLVLGYGSVFDDDVVVVDLVLIGELGFLVKFMIFDGVWVLIWVGMVCF